ncbi:ion channel [Chloroflexota bacterium]
MGDSFYFSAFTFVTFGFGGPWYPSPGHWIKYVVMSEGLFGAFFIALFVMTFGHRMMR